MVLRPFHATFPRLQRTKSVEEFIETVKEKYVEYRSRKVFRRAEEEAMYVYEIESNGLSQVGLIAAVSIQDYLEERVKRHEHTLVDKEVKQADLLKERNAVVKPVLLAHRHHQALADLLSGYVQKKVPGWELNLSHLSEIHRFWPITEREDIEHIQYYFGRYIQTTYIADGHHRFSATARLYQQLAETDQHNTYEYLMCALFPSTSLHIHNFNRVIKAVGDDRSALSFMAELSQYANLRPLKEEAAPKHAHELTFFLKGEWFAMKWREETLNHNAKAGLPTLDVSMFNYYVLRKILGFMDIRNDKRIKYIEGPRGLQALADATDGKPAVSFCLYPLSWESFFQVIDHGLILPPKSTWFEPRMKNGLIVQSFGKGVGS
ncbi:MAG: DUF1015 family protein [Bacteroidota bacterium]